MFTHEFCEQPWYIWLTEEGAQVLTFSPNVQAIVSVCSLADLCMDTWTCYKTESLCQYHTNTRKSFVIMEQNYFMAFIMAPRKSEYNTGHLICSCLDVRCWIVLMPTDLCLSGASVWHGVAATETAELAQPKSLADPLRKAFVGPLLCIFCETSSIKISPGKVVLGAQ